MCLVYRTQEALLAVRAAATEVVLGLMGVRPLPVGVATGAVPDVLVSDLPGFWDFVTAVQQPVSSASAFGATMGVVRGDMYRKLRDQRVGSAGIGAVMPGWEAMRSTFSNGIAPLYAYARPPQRPGMPVVMVLHGMYDSKHSRYVRAIGATLANAGFGVVLPDGRWHGELYTRDWLPSLGVREAQDILAWRRALHDYAPGSPLVLLGFSLGALHVIHAMAADRANAFAGGIAVCPPAALEYTVTHLDRRSRFADEGLTALIRDFFHEALRSRRQALGLPASSEPFRDLIGWLEERVGLPLLSAAEPSTRLREILRPLLVISSRNDPVFPTASLGALQAGAATNPLVHVVTTATGGHIGQIACYQSWFAATVTRFVAASASVPDERLWPEVVRLPSRPVAARPMLPVTT